MVPRRSFLQTTAAAALAVPSAARAATPAEAAVRPWRGKPTLFVRNQPVLASFYALTDCPGGRWSYDEAPRQAMQQFVDAGFRLFQLDLFLEDCWPTADAPFSIEPARRQLRGVLDICPEGAVVLRWHVNAPMWWNLAHPEELTRYDNGDFEQPERTQPRRYLMDDLRRLPRASLASEKWMQLAREKTAALLKGLATTEEGAALAGLHVACGVYGEWHYWGFMRNEPDTSAPMQQWFANWRRKQGRPPAPVPSTAERKALDNGIFRDPARREAVIDYYRAQQQLVADRIVELCQLVKQSWPRPLITGTFYGYFFSVFNRHATGGHLCLHQVLASPHVDYLSAPQAYGAGYRDPGGSGITRALIETVRANGKLFLDEMDQTPSWVFKNDVDTAFALSDVPKDIAILRRNVLESYTRGAGLWYYDFGPANLSGWWLDTRLMAEVKRIFDLCSRYHAAQDYEPAGDVLYVFDTDVFYYTGSIPPADPMTDPAAVNRTIVEAWSSGAAIETVHLRDLDRIDLSRFRVVVFANTWILTKAQREFIRQRVVGSSGRHVVFQGLPGYGDGQRYDIALAREATGLDLRPATGLPFTPALRLGDREPGFARQGNRNTWFAAEPPITRMQLRQVCQAAGAHLYTDGAGDIVHAGGGLVLVHSRDGGPSTLRFRGGKALPITLSPMSSLVFDARSGERLL